MALVLPLDSVDPHYTVTVKLEGVRYRLGMDWNEREGSWYLSVAQEDDTAIVSGLRVVPDWPLLRRVADSARPPGEIVFRNTNAGDTEPGRYDIGKIFVPLYYEEDEL
jgi:hypothetical protein